MGLGKQYTGLRQKTARRKGAEYETREANHDRSRLACRAVAGRWSALQGFLSGELRIVKTSPARRACFVNRFPREESDP